MAPDANFCTKCGKVVTDEVAVSAAPPVFEEVENSGYGNTYVAPEEKSDPVKDSRGGSILTYAILGLAFTSSFYFAFLGLICSIVARVKVRRYVADYGSAKGRASVGNGLSIAGLILSIVLTVILCIVVVAFIASFVFGIVENGVTFEDGMYF